MKVQFKHIPLEYEFEQRSESPSYDYCRCSDNVVWYDTLRNNVLVRRYKGVSFPGPGHPASTLADVGCTFCYHRVISHIRRVL